MKLAVEGVSFTYPTGVLALRDVDLVIGAGESVALIGENGAGKSTLAKQINGLLKPSRGRVTVGDWDTRQKSPAQLARRVGHVFQNPDDQLFERTVFGEVAFGPRNLGYSGTALQAKVQQALAQVGLEEQGERHPYDLHPSQRKMVALAATLAMGAPVLILDEPTTGHDVSGVARIGQIVESLKAEGRTVLAISHDLDFCGEHFERIVVMSGGRILADGDADQILRQADVLASAGVEPPQLVRLALALGLPGAPQTAGAFVNTLAEHRGSQVVE